MSRCTKAAKIRRVSLVYRLLLRGIDTTDAIQEYLHKNHSGWNVNDRQIRTYKAEAEEMLAKAASFERNQEFGRALGRLHALYDSCESAGRYRDALAVQAEINKLCDLYAPQKIELTEVLPLLDDEIARQRREVAELERQFALASAPETPS